MAITPLKVTDFVTNRKSIHDLLLVINNNFSLHHSLILHRQMQKVRLKV